MIFSIEIDKEGVMGSRMPSTPNSTPYTLSLKETQF
jgi:hypothetical protein